MKKFIERYNITIKDSRIDFTNLETNAKTEKLFDLNLDDVHDQISKIEYEKEYKNNGKIVDKEIENFQMMPFVFAFYYLLVLNMKIPTPTQVTDFYVKMFCTKIQKGIYTFKPEYLDEGRNITFKYTSLKARLLRAYNSYIREIELFMQLKKELKDKANVEYSMIDDLYNGVDISVNYNGTKYSLATYVETKRSCGFKNRKNKYRHDYSDFNNIDVKAIMSGPEKNVIEYGDVKVYKPQVVKDIVKKMKEITEKTV